MPSLDFLRAWPHECCYPGWCYYRQPAGSVMECHAPAECDYLRDKLIREAETAA